MVYLDTASMLSLLRPCVQSLVRELISHEPFGVAKKKKKGMRRVRVWRFWRGLKTTCIWILEKMKWWWSEKCLKMSYGKGSHVV